MQQTFDDAFLQLFDDAFKQFKEAFSLVVADPSVSTMRATARRMPVLGAAPVTQLTLDLACEPFYMQFLFDKEDGCEDGKSSKGSPIISSYNPYIVLKEYGSPHAAPNVHMKRLAEPALHPFLDRIHSINDGLCTKLQDVWMVKDAMPPYRFGVADTGSDNKGQYVRVVLSYNPK